MKRHLFTALFLAAVVTGCNGTGSAPWNKGGGPGPVAIGNDPKAAQLVAILNKNAAQVPGIESMVSVDVKKGNEAVTLEGLLACHKPRDFRLKARIAGAPMVDMGSNGEEFWYWIGKADPPYVFHCSYQDFDQGAVRMPFPFQPDMVVAALGIGTYSEQKQYQVRPNPQQGTVELIEAVTVQGQQMTKATVFDTRNKSVDRPTVIGHVLRDAKGQEVCTVTIKEIQRDKATGATFPYLVHMACKGQNMQNPQGPPEVVEMTLRLEKARVVQHNQEDVQRLFTRVDLARYESYDLAKQKVDRIERVRGSGQP